jgi:hypothetical protein
VADAAVSTDGRRASDAFGAGISSPLHVGCVVDKVYFTDGQNDIAVPVTDQADTSLKVAIPAKAKVGVRYRLMILTKGKEPKLIEQPVRVEVEE